MSYRKTTHSLLPRLEALRFIIEKAENKEKKKTFLQHKEMFEVVKEYSIRNNLILYGGMALNELLPKSAKFYPEFEVPDYDMFSYDAKPHAIAIADELMKKGYRYIEVKTARHPGTFKVYAEFISVADVTQINKSLYDYLLKESDKNTKKHYSDKRLIISPIVYLKWCLYKELSSPEGSMFRWEKVFKRFTVFDKHYKLPKVTHTTKNNIDTEPDVARFLKDLIEIIKARHIPVVGSFAISVHMNEHNTSTCYVIDPYFSTFEILSENIEVTQKEILDFIKIPSGYEIVTVKRNNTGKYFDQILPVRSRVFLRHVQNKSKLYPVLTIHDASDNCFSVKKKQGFTLGTVDTILQILYAYYMTYTYFEKDMNIPNKILQLLVMFETHVNSTIKDPVKRITSHCYGTQKTLTNIKKENWNKKGFIYRPSGTLKV